MNSMKTRAVKQITTFVLLFIFAAAFCLIPQQVRAASNFYIEDYDVQVVVNEDDTYVVTETISVHFTYPSHGIYRTIPLKTTLDRDGQKTSYYARIKDFEILSGENWSDESDGSDFSARIGDSGVIADIDTVYKIRYTYDTRGDHFDGGDEVYYNLIGTSWEALSIDSVSFDVKFPKAIDMSKVGVKTGNNEMVPFEIISDTEIKGETSKFVMNGLTIRAVLPEGYFTRQAKASNRLLYIISALMLLLAAAGFVFWRKYGRDPHIVETEEFYPPEGLSAPEVGYLSDGTIKGSHVISTLLSLADKGYLRIAEREEVSGLRKNKTKTTYEIIKVREYADNVVGERTFMEGLFEEGDAVSLDQLKNKFYKTVKVIEIMIKNNYKGKLYDAKAARYARILKIGGIAGVIMIMLACLLGGSALGLGSLSAIISSAYMILMAGGLIIAGFVGITKKINDRKHYFGIIGFALCILAGLVLCFILDIASGITFIPFVVGLGMSFVLFIMSALCERKTDWYASVLGKIRGYRNFLEIAEKDKMEALAEEDPKYFYKNLAFAFAMGVTAVYAKNFASLATEPPEWYDSAHAYSGGNSVTSMTFLNSMDSMMSSISSSMTSSPSDGGGGGSFSGGGGGGGGGGGSW